MTIESTGAAQGHGGTIVFRGSFHRVRRAGRHELAEGMAEPSGPVAAQAHGPRPAKIAVLLAFAHHVQRLIDEGRVADRAEVARRLGWTRARVSQVLDLLMLAPDLQEDVLFVAPAARLTERTLREVIRYEGWCEQREAMASLRL